MIPEILLLAGLLALDVRTLPNGLVVAVDRVPGATGVAAVVAVGAGSADDTPLAGLAHYLEHMLFKGTAKYAPGEVHAAIESHGGEFNAFTASDLTAYWVEIPRPHLALALDVLAEATLRPAFPPAEVERERTVIQEERRRRLDRPSIRLWDLAAEAAFTVHPYGRPGVGTETSIESIGRDDMIAYHRTFYVPANMALIVSGDVETGDVVNLAQRFFGSAAGGPAPARRRPAEPASSAPRTVTYEADVGRAHWALAALGPAARGAETAVVANAALDVAAAILAGGEASPLRRRLVDDLRIADEVSAWWSTSRDPDLMLLTGVCEPIDLPLVEREVRRGLARLAASPPSAEEVDVAKARIEAEWAVGTEAPRARAHRLAYFWAVQGLDEHARYIERVRAITPDDVRRAAAALAPPVFVALAPPGGAEAGETAVTLPNGLRVILRPDSASPVAAFVVGLEVGQADEETAGAAALLAAVLPRGAGGRTADDLARAWEGAGLAVGAGAEPDFMTVSAVGPAEVAGLALRAVGDLVLEADLEAAEVEAARARTLARIAAKHDDPFEWAYDRLRSIALPGPYGRPLEGDETSVRSLTRDALAALRDRAFVASRAVLVGEGRFDAAAVLAEVRRRFGGLPPGAPRARPASAAPPPPRPETEATIVRPGAAQGLLLLGWDAPPAGDESYAAFKVVNALLGGASQARLFRHLREESGLAYAVGSFYPTRAGASLLVAHLGTDAANLEKDLAGEVLAVLRRLRAELDEGELEAAKEKTLGDFLLDHQAAARRAWYRAWYESIGLGAGYDEAYPAAVRAVTLEDARRALDRLIATPPVVVGIRP